MSTQGKALVECTGAVFKDSGDLIRDRRQKEAVVFTRSERLAFQERHHRIQYSGIAAAFDVVRGDVSQPRTVVGNASPHALAGMGQPPMLDVAFNELP